MGVDTGTAAPEALPAAKHIFSHIEWHMNGILLHVPAKMPRPGCVLGKPGSPAGRVYAARCV